MFKTHADQRPGKDHVQFMPYLFKLLILYWFRQIRSLYNKQIAEFISSVTS